MSILLDRTMGENVQVSMSFEPGELWASTDVSQLESAVLNLAINARDAMPEGGTLTIETRSERASAGKSAVSIIVRDTGTGMPQDVVANVFEPFFTTKPLGQGTGLGLSMVYGFVKQSGGDVQIDSEVGRGTAIILRFPGSAPEKHSRTEQTPPQQNDGAGKTVLVVEDDSQLRMLILEVLRDIGYSAIEANGSEQALAALGENEVIDLVISDVGMPGMNGRQLADLARKDRPNLPILFMTGYSAEAAVRSDFLESGMDMITKPFQFEDLTAKIREMTEHERRRDA
jgi:CheY-like chemotaxis protein